MNGLKVYVVSLVFMLGIVKGSFPGTVSSGNIQGPPGSVMVDSIVWTGLDVSDNVVAVICSLYIHDGNVAYFYNGEDYPHIMWRGQTHDWYDNQIPADPSRWMFPASQAYVDTSFWDANNNPWGFPPVKAKVVATTGSAFSSGNHPLVIYFFVQMGWTNNTRTTITIKVKAIDNSGSVLGTASKTKRINVQNPPPLSISGHVTTWDGDHIRDAIAYIEGGNIGYATDTTNHSGAFSFTGLAQGNDYTVYVEKPEALSISAITVYDAYLVASQLTGNGSLSDDQLRVANTQQRDNHFANNPYAVPAIHSGENNLNENDVRAILAYIVGRPDHVRDNYTGFWFFYPYWRNYNNLTSDVTDADFTGYLMGDVDGNYAKKAPMNEAPVVKIDDFVPGRQVSKVFVQSTAHGFSIEFRYDPASVSIKRVVKAPTAPADLVYDYSIENGIVRISGITVNGKIQGYIFDIYYEARSVQKPVLRKIGLDNREYIQNLSDKRFFAKYSGGEIYLNAALQGRANYDLFTVDGRRVGSGVINGPVVKVGNLSQGVYFFRVKTSNGESRVARFVVLR